MPTAAFKGSQTIAVSSGTEFIRMSAFARLCDGTSNDILTLTGAPTAFVTQMETYWLSPNGFPADQHRRHHHEVRVGHGDHRVR